MTDRPRPVNPYGPAHAPSRSSTGAASVTVRASSSVPSPAGTLTRSVAARPSSADGSTAEVKVQCRIDTLDELEYYRNGGILQYVLRQLAA